MGVAAFAMVQASNEP